MKNIADTKSHQDTRRPIAVAYVQTVGFVMRFFPNKTPVVFKKHRKPIYGDS